MGTVERSVRIVGILALGFGSSAANATERETRTACGVGRAVSANGQTADVAHRDAPRGVPSLGCDDGTVIDLMVVYTASARQAAGGTTEIHDRIQIAVDDVNDALARSEIETTIRLVHQQEVDYTESGQAAIDAPRLINDGDGQLDDVHPLRDFHGADCVSLWVENFDFGGVGFFPHPSLAGIGASGFTIMRQDNYVFHTLAHELGHNFYCAHDRANAPDAPYAEYSYGYREPGAAWHDIMAYPPGDTIPYFANPNVNWPGPDPPNPGPTGVPVGESDPCDIARTMNELRFHVANFRPTSVPGLPNKLYVRTSAPVGGNGLSWGTAFRDLQEALCKAAGSQGAVQELWVAAGTYKPDRGSGDRAETFYLMDGVALYGGFNGTETLLSQRNVAANVTVLSGDIGVAGDNMDNSFHVVDGTGTGPTAVLDGFIIRAGRADGGTNRDEGGAGLINYPGGSPTVANCIFTQNTAAWYGAAVYNRYDNASPSFTACTFSNNTALGADWPAGGGAVFNYDNCNPTFDGCTFTDNFGNIGGAMANLFACSPTITNCSFQQNQAPGNNREGGAIYNYTSCHPVLTDCTFTLNTAERGGGVYAAFDCDPALTRCAFTGNTASGVNPAEGGGLYGYEDVNAVLVDCTFTGNTAVGAGGGGMITVYNSAPSLTRCAFTGNSARDGGAILNYGNVSPTVKECVFRDNQAEYGGAMSNYYDCSPTVTACIFSSNDAVFEGGGLDNYTNSSPQLVNCLFAGNTASYGGAMITLFSSDAVVTNCTAVGNFALNEGGGIHSYDADPRLVNTILWGNTAGQGSVEAQQMSGLFSAPVVDYCTIQGWTGGLGGTSNSGSDPLFVDADGTDDVSGTPDDNARLRMISPAVDSGDYAALPPGVTTDLDLRPRIVGGAVDRGAYETGSSAPGDYDQDGDVDLGDHARFIDCLDGPNVPPSPPAPLDPQECLAAFDFGDDGDVDLEDCASFQDALNG